MERLENDIALLGRAMVFPDTPSLATRIRARIESPDSGRAQSPRWQLALTGLAAAIVALALITGVAAPARDAVADIFDRINIFEVDEVPPDTTRDITGIELSLEAAEDAVDFPLLLPNDAPPDRVLLQDFGQVKSAVLFHRHDNGTPYALFETNTAVAKGLSVGKGVLEEGQAEPVEGLGSEAYWLTGLRLVQYYNLDGAVLQDSVRATDVNTLLWNEGGRIFRIEGDLTQEEATTIAHSLRTRSP
jgi:hypothetical protein